MLRPVSNPPNPWRSTEVEWLGPPPEAGLELFEERAKSALSENKSPDLPFRFSVNPYRGCFHACAYCYARPTHQYLDFGAGTDFDRKIVVKVNVAEALAQELARGRAKGEHLVFSGNTDCYQPLEAHYRLTRSCLEVCRDFKKRLVIITKGPLVQRDVDLLADLHERAGVRVILSLGFADVETARLVEPHVASPERRLEALARLGEAGIPIGLAFSPAIPGLNDAHIPWVLERAAQAGVTTAFMTLLRLAPEVETVFRARLAETAPGRADKVLSALRDARGGDVAQGGFGKRFVGVGARWKLVDDLFRLHCRRNGIAFTREESPEFDLLGRAGAGGDPAPTPRMQQRSLFD